MKIHFINQPSPFYPDFEIIERKGAGHPDTLSDGLAEELSIEYANYTLNRFGAVLHHNFDKVGLLGGAAEVDFGKGMLTKPIRVLINGRASHRFGRDEVPVKDILLKTTKRFLKEKLPKINPEIDLLFLYHVSTSGSPGYVKSDCDSSGSRKYWFNPRDLKDIRDINRLNSNDTSVGCAHFPLSELERCVLFIENRLNSKEYKHDKPWLGSDIKIMACRIEKKLDITMCIPQIADDVSDLDAYKKNIKTVRKDILSWLEDHFSFVENNLHTNTKDDYNLPELYLTAIGSSIESGDEGLVGRGNRINGLISSCRPYSMEGACGKNPVYHVGKLYNIIAQKIAENFYEEFHSTVEVYLIGQEGRSLEDPWQVAIVHDGKNIDKRKAEKIICRCLKDIPKYTQQILNHELTIY